MGRRDRSGENEARRAPGRAGRIRPALAVLLLVAGLGTAALVSAQIGAAAPGGWYAATVPGTGADDVLLGSDCANALQCWAVGVSISNISAPNAAFATCPA